MYPEVYKQGSDQKKALLVFDGAMSDAHVWINGQKVGNHPYGYAYFYFDISGLEICEIAEIVNNEITFQQFKTLTTEGFLGQVNNIDFTGYITKPPPTATQSP